ncbi:MAG: phosphatase PAP2 family protein [Burkholderiaceae bacterium]|nr:MAG: phosphatase PAP2 family protein [Burkholderiaceae bacterium]
MLPLDIAAFHALNAGAGTPAAVIDLARWISSGLPLVGAGLLAGALAAGSRSTRRAVALGLASLLLTWCVVSAIRWSFPMPRPAQLGLGMQWIDQGARAGFPSMHTATAFALAMGLTLGRLRLAAALAWLCAVAMAWSRVCLGVHFPSDVIAGALAVPASAWAVFALRERWLRPRGRFSAYWFRPARPSARRT